MVVSTCNMAIMKEKSKLMLLFTPEEVELFKSAAANCGQMVTPWALRCLKALVDYDRGLELGAVKRVGRFEVQGTVGMQWHCDPKFKELLIKTARKAAPSVIAWIRDRLPPLATWEAVNGPYTPVVGVAGEVKARTVKDIFNLRLTAEEKKLAREGSDWAMMSLNAWIRKAVRGERCREVEIETEQRLKAGQDNLEEVVEGTMAQFQAYLAKRKENTVTQ